MASHLNPPNRQSHVCNSSQIIRDIRHACLTRLLGVKVEIYQLPTLPTSSLRTSSPTSGEPLVPSSSFWTCIHKVYYYGYLVYCDYFNSIVGARKCSFFLVSLCFLCESPILMVMTMRGMISHPSALIASNSGSYLSCFVLMPWSMYHNFWQPIVYVLFTIRGG